MDNNFHIQILFTAESIFNLGLFNRNNTRHWAQDNTRLLIEGAYQERPFIFDRPLNGERYLSFLRERIEEFLEDIPLIGERNIIFQQDGAPADNSRAVVEHLNQRF
ncbi:hypothetical protein HHI36_001988, partial [Cryptolaemus montrouzieri]